MLEEEHIRRPNAVEMLQSYVSDTLDCFDTVTAFCYTNFKWVLWRETELELIRDIQERASRLNRGFLQVFKSTEKGKAFGEYLRPKSSGTRREELEKELATVLKNTREGVEKLTCFLDAVEKLAVTSLQVFTGGEEVVKLSLGFSLESVKAMILAARLVCPLLLHFKRDAEVFFTPSLHNVAVFEAVLDKYIRTTEIICNVMCSAIDFEDEPPQVQLAEDLTLDVVQNISSHVDQLSDIREDQDFRLLFLFQGESVSGFVDQFSECLPRMLKFLDEMEGCAVQLDRMKKGSKISSVAGSSVGAVGGVMTLVGLALAPWTAGASLGLTYWGLGMGVTSGVNSIVTAVTETAVNGVQNSKASGDLQSFMKDVESIQASLDTVINQRESEFEEGNWDKAKVVKGVLKEAQISPGVDKMNEAIIKVVIRSVVKNTAKKIGSVLFIGLDIYTICTDGISLASGKQSEASEFIRARAVLLRSEVDCWKIIHDSVGTGTKQFESRKDVLQSSFRN